MENKIWSVAKKRGEFLIFILWNSSSAPVHPLTTFLPHERADPVKCGSSNVIENCSRNATKSSRPCMLVFPDVRVEVKPTQAGIVQSLQVHYKEEKRIYFPGWLDHRLSLVWGASHGSGDLNLGGPSASFVLEDLPGWEFPRRLWLTL